MRPIRRFATVAAVGLVGALVCASGAAVWARADKHPRVHAGNVSIKTLADQNFCLQSDAVGPLIVSTCAARNDERFTFTDNPDGTNVLTTGNGECLDRGNEKLGTPLVAAPCTFDADQRFTYNPTTGKLGDFVAGRCVAVGKAAQDATVFLARCHDPEALETFALGE